MRVDVKIYGTIIVLIITISRVCSNYIYYKSLNRQCSAVLNCGRGYEIVPCKTQFMEDLCTPCKEGFVQPELISSTGDLNASSCFKSIHDCFAHDITYSRIPKHAFCDSLSGCKCDTTKCYYGDPCLCDNGDECDKGHFMNQSGTCIPCPEGTEKNHTGCGPCRNISGYVPVEKPKVYATIAISSTRTTNKMYITTDQSASPVTADQSASPVTAMKVSTGAQEEKNDKLLIILIITFGVAVLILSIVIIIICSKRAGIVVFGGICWANDISQRERQDVEANQIQMEGQPFLVDENGQDVPINERQTDGGNVTANPVDDKKSQSYNNNSNSEPHDSCGSSGYGDGEHLDHSFEEHERCSLNNESDKNKSEKDNHNKTEEVGPLSVGTIPFETSVNREESVKQKINKAKFELEPLNIETLRDKDNTGYTLSESKSPVTTETEPNDFKRAIWQDNTNPGSTSGYQSETSNDFPSGSYISMHVSENRSFETEELPSAVETYAFNLTGTYTGEEQCYKHKDLIKDNSQRNTAVKNSGPDSWTSCGGDSGIQIV